MQLLKLLYMDFKEHLTKLGQGMSVAALFAFLCKPFDLSSTLVAYLSFAIFFIIVILVYLSQLGRYLSKEKLIISLLCISVFYNVYLYDQQKTKDSQEQVDKYYDESEDIFQDIDTKLKNSKGWVWFYGTNFHITADDRRSTILSLVKSGVRIRFLVLDPRINDYELVTNTLAPGEPVSSLKNECEKSIIDLIKLQQESQALIASGAQGSIEIRLINVIPHNRIYLFDPQDNKGEELFIPYINGLLSAQSPAYSLRANSTTTQSHYKAVNLMWSKSKDLGLWQKENNIF